ncbi:hypothetical protein HKX48_006766 [Thoreauomyces humboldtii]|nr:hypothetical protein HKX48_006766 [Thoreauomyces humboldtii]
MLSIESLPIGVPEPAQDRAFRRLARPCTDLTSEKELKELIDITNYVYQRGITKKKELLTYLKTQCSGIVVCDAVSVTVLELATAASNPLSAPGASEAANDKEFRQLARPMTDLTSAKQLKNLIDVTNHVYQQKITKKKEILEYLKTYCMGFAVCEAASVTVLEAPTVTSNLVTASGNQKKKKSPPASSGPTTRSATAKKLNGGSNAPSRGGSFPTVSQKAGTQQQGFFSAAFSTPQTPTHIRFSSRTAPIRAPPIRASASDRPPAVNDIDWRPHYFPDISRSRASDTFDHVLLGQRSTNSVISFGLLGTVMPSQGVFPKTFLESDLYLNTQAPFCMVAVGLQGTGKRRYGCRRQGHYDKDPQNFPEAATLPTGHFSGLPFVSPSNLQARKLFYAQKGIANCTVKPLLFRWADLSSEEIQTLMRTTRESQPLYISSIFDMPSWREFLAELDALQFTSMQAQPLKLRLNMIESFLVDAAENQQHRGGHGTHTYSVTSLLTSTANDWRRPLIIVDLTDKLMSGSDANAIFQVLLASFLEVEIPGGKLVVLDEAHKYLQTDGSGLTEDIVETAAQMRHTNMRLAISTQSPMSLPASLLELCSFTLLHKMQSPAWYKHLGQASDLELGNEGNHAAGDGRGLGGQHKDAGVSKLADDEGLTVMMEDPMDDPMDVAV